MTELLNLARSSAAPHAKATIERAMHCLHEARGDVLVRAALGASLRTLWDGLCVPGVSWRCSLGSAPCAASGALGSRAQFLPQPRQGLVEHGPASPCGSFPHLPAAEDILERWHRALTGRSNVSFHSFPQEALELLRQRGPQPDQDHPLAGYHYTGNFQRGLWACTVAL